MQTRLNPCSLCLRASLLAGLSCAGLFAPGCKDEPIRRTTRKHPPPTSKAFDFLREAPDVDCNGNRALTGTQVARDLNQLEWLLENKHSYLKRKGVDYRQALDTIHASSSAGSTRGRLALQITELLALFADAHSRVVRPNLLRDARNFAPFLACWQKQRLIAVKPNRSGFLDEDHPYLVKLDGRDVGAWLTAAESLCPRGSQPFTRRQSTRLLRGVQLLRARMGLPLRNSVALTLQSADGETTVVELPLCEEMPMYGRWPWSTSRVVGGNLGYLRIAVMDDSPGYVEELVKLVVRFKDTAGLIIDVRGNGGGGRAPLRALLPFFLPPDSPPRVLNVAAIRRGFKEGAMENRWLYPADWEGWTKTERDAIERVSRRFHPEWTPPADRFSRWHYLLAGPRTDPPYYHYAKPVVVLMNEDDFSASDIFLGAFKGLPNVTLMGTPSSGGSGRCIGYRLHHSDIEITLSSMASFQPDGKLYDGNGIAPDVLVEPSPTDFLCRTDTTLDAAVAFLDRPATEEQP